MTGGRDIFVKEVLGGAYDSQAEHFLRGDVDVVMLSSVLEHLAEPQSVIQSAWRLLRGSGLLLVNVPTWSGKRFLELSAFQLGFSPKVEIDDHKMYYDKRDLWPMLVRAGFKPSQIRLRYHKFGLNLFAAARKDAADQRN